MTLSEKDKVAIRTLLDREPTVVEEKIFDTMWSEHCSYKSSKLTLKTLPVKGSEVALGIGEDAGIIRFTKHNGKQYCLALSHESHNHPSQILPIEGAATGVGGCVRDVYCMGADVIGVLDSLHFGVPQSEKDSMVTEIAEKVVEGVADYGNPLGVPVLGGETLYHPSYNDNCLVNVAAIGLLEERDIIHSYTPERAKTEPYDVILFGKSTDMTGFGGASFSSATLDQSDQATNIGAVQVHDPFLKRVLVEAIKELVKWVSQEKIDIGFKDLGAGGISCAVSEIASGSNFGVKIDLDKVNVSIDNLKPEVIACSETQERFCIVVPKKHSKHVLSLFNTTFALPQLYPQAGAVVIGEILTEPICIMTHKGETVCSLPVHCITTEVRENRVAQSRPIPKEVKEIPSISLEKIEKHCEATLAEKNNVYKRPIYRHYDNAVRGNTFIYPGEADAVVVVPIAGCKTGMAVSMDSNLYGEHDPYVSGAYATAESIRNVIAVGGKPIALTDCLNYGNPENPSVFFDFQEGVRGIKEAAEGLGIIPGEPVPIVSGNVSFYNDSKQGNAVIPSPVVMCVGRVDSIQTCLTLQLTKPNEILICVGKRYPEFGGTQAQSLAPEIQVAPQVRIADEAKQNEAMMAIMDAKWASACHDISMGGLWQCLVEMVLGERGNAIVGCDIQTENVLDLATLLFSENGGYVISVPVENVHKVKQTLESKSVEYQVIGKTTESREIVLSKSGGVLKAFQLSALITALNA